MNTINRLGRVAAGAVVALALVITGCDSLFDDQITPYDGPDFVEFGQVCPPTPCYQRTVQDTVGVTEVRTNLIGPQRSAATEMRFRFVERIFTQQATLQGQPGFTTVAGNTRATIVDDTGETFLRTNISGATAGAMHPWHVRTGTCAEPGSIVGSTADYPPLEVGSEGQAIAEATLSVPLEFGQPYHVRIAVPGDQDSVAACGNLGSPTVMYQTTAEEGVHFALPQGTSYTMPANSSFGYIQVAPIPGVLAPGVEVRVAIELLGAADGSIGAAGPGPERLAADHMKYFTLVIRGS